MITHGFADLPKDPGLMRAVVRDANQQVGVYARVEASGPGARRRYRWRSRTETESAARLEIPARRRSAG